MEVKRRKWVRGKRERGKEGDNSTPNQFFRSRRLWFSADPESCLTFRALFSNNVVNFLRNIVRVTMSIVNLFNCI